jgi:hypothetical protein
LQEKKKKFQDCQEHLQLVLAWKWVNVISEKKPMFRKKVNFMNETDTIIKQNRMFTLLKLLIAVHDGIPNTVWATKTGRIVEDWQKVAQNKNKVPEWNESDFEAWTSLAGPKHPHEYNQLLHLKDREKIPVNQKNPSALYDPRADLRTILEYKTEDEKESTD